MLSIRHVVLEVDNCNGEKRDGKTGNSVCWEWGISLHFKREGLPGKVWFGQIQERGENTRLYRYLEEESIGNKGKCLRRERACYLGKSIKGGKTWSWENEGYSSRRCGPKGNWNRGLSWVWVSRSKPWEYTYTQVIYYGNVLQKKLIRGVIKKGQTGKEQSKTVILQGSSRVQITPHIWSQLQSTWLGFLMPV